MLRNYFIITLRSLMKNGVYSFINIAGLTIGLGCSILILLWVNDELSFDNFHEKRGQLYRVYAQGIGDNDKIYTQQAVPLPLWESFKANEPDIKHVAPTNWGRTYLLTYGEKRLYKKGYAAGDDFLKMFSFPLIKGKADDQLKDPSTIVLTESTARSLFGDEEPIGKIVRLDDQVDLTVTAIVKDVPSN
jgi:putative ABC transport system permease protein